MKTSEQTNEIFAALAMAQAATEAATKDNTNPAFRSKYADLTSHVEVIRPAAKAAKLAVLQELTSDDSGVHVTTRIAHASGQWIEFGPLYIPANKHDAQGFGSAASYARRYALSAAWGTVADDDDGNAAVASTSQTNPTSKRAMPKPLVPEGYDEWVEALRKAATTGIAVERFREIYAASKLEHRRYLEVNNKGLLDSLVEKITKAA